MMNIFRSMAQISLIHKLLISSTIQRLETIKDNQALIDAELLEIINQLAKDSHKKLDLKTIITIKCIALEIELLEVIEPFYNDHNKSITSLEESNGIFIQILQHITIGQFSEKKVFEILTSKQAYINSEFLQFFPSIISGILINTDERQKPSMAAVIGTFGDLISQFSLGQRGLNIEFARIAYQLILLVRTQEAMPFEWALTMNNLATAYCKRIYGNHAQNIEEALCAYHKAIQIRTRESMPDEWAQTMNSLGIAYGNRLQGNLSQNIEDSIKSYEQSLTVIKSDTKSIEWATLMNNLASSFYRRIEGDRAQNIEDSISYYKQALQVRTRDKYPVEWAMSIMNLATSYSGRIRGERAQNIEEAINFYHQASDIITCEAMPVEWAKLMVNLAGTYISRIQGDRAQNIEEAINFCKQAQQISSREALPIQWAESMTNLASAYISRIRGDRAQNIEEAISILKQIQQVKTKKSMPIEWAKSMNNLVAAYIYRIRGEKAQNLEDAINLSEQILEIISQKEIPVEWGRSMMNLANIYRERIYGDRAQNIEDAISAYEQVLQIVTLDALPFQWAAVMMNLASTYILRVNGDRSDNIEKAILAYQQSLQIRTIDSMPIEWAEAMMGLATAYTQRTCVDSEENIEKAIDIYEQALRIFQPDQLPNFCRRTARLLGNLCADNKHWSTAVKAYQQALEAMEILYQSSLLLSSQTAELSEANDLFRRTAFAQAKADDLFAALITIERGRARGLSDTLERDRAELAEVATLAPGLYQEYQDAVEALRQLEIYERSLSTSASTNQPSLSQDELRQRATIIREQVRKAIGGIRQLSGYSDFLTQPDLKDIIAAIQPNQPLVYLITTPNGSLALIAQRPSSNGNGKLSKAVQLYPIWLNDLTESLLVELLQGSSAEPTGWFGAYANQQKNSSTWLNTIEQVTRKLWDLLMGPVVAKLADLGMSQAILIPTGYLGFLPLHTAWTEDDTTPSGRLYALDLADITYAPNARSLKVAQDIAKLISAHSLLAVNEPRPTNASALPNSEREVESALSYFPQHQSLSYEQATRKTVLAAMPHHSILHFSCHGYANSTTPLDSGLLMADNELLTLRDFFNLQLQGIRLAILSACETGLMGPTLPDEVISLPTGLLQAGVAGVVASLWSVADLSTMILLVRFYDIWRRDELDSREALRQAQRWVRDSTNGEKVAYFKDFLPKASPNRMAAETADFLYKQIILERPEARDFAHPVHWAAFSYVGV